METRLSNKIRLLLNELAILNQPEQIDGKIQYEKEILLKIRSLSTELYFLTAQSVESGDFLAADSVQPRVTQPDVVTELLSEVAPEFGAWPEPDLLIAETPETAIEEVVVVAPEDRQEPAQPSAPVTEPVIAHEPENLPEPDLTPAELKDNSLPAQNKRNAESVNNQISLTRRFEYINNLFGGNAELYLEFLAVLAESKTEDQAMDIFKKAFQENNWIRREETAQDLKKMIHKIF